jgi:uncharacterized protein
VTKHPPRLNLLRAIAGVPFKDERGNKGWFDRISRAQPHVVRSLALNLPGWPRWSRPLRAVLMADFHTGSHAGDVERLAALVAQANEFAPDLALLGGDYVNMQPFGRVPPRVIAAILARLEASCGRFAIIGNHDVYYDADEVTKALQDHGIVVLDDAQGTVHFENHAIAIAGVPDIGGKRPTARALVAGLPPDEPTIILSHDPVWFADVTSQSHLTLAGHTHGGQIRMPLVGAIYNGSKAPLRWTHGLVVEGGRHLYVTSGLGTSGVPIRVGVPPEFVVMDLIGR